VRSIKRTLLAAVAAALLVPASAAAVPPGFFGISPQTELRPADTARMRQARIGTVRVPVLWGDVQPSAREAFNWAPLDATVALTARDRLTVLPFLYGTPGWLAGKATTLPVDNARQRQAWTTFLRAAVDRYGPGGEFWREHDVSSRDYVPPRPIRAWQIWNEENFFYFAKPASPERYGRLLKLANRAIASRDRGALLIAGGLFGNPRQGPPLAMKASQFVARLYRLPGIKAALDGIALHPYAPDVPTLRVLTEEVRDAVVRAHDRAAGLYITELGWGSQLDPQNVAFEVGVQGQARNLRAAYRYLVGNRGRLNLKQVDWYSWKDAPPGICNFCDSVGLFRRGLGFHPKPAWHAFVGVTHGRF
jgi:hypothetical protein